MRKKAILLLLVFILSMFVGCSLMKEECFSQFKVGENFGSNIDGYYKKLPHNYCLMVLIGTRAKLFNIPEALSDEPFFTNSVYNTSAILEGRYIKGYYDNEKLILCEEVSMGNFEYLVFDFETQKINRIIDKKQLDDYGKITWFWLCNTIEEGIQ